MSGCRLSPYRLCRFEELSLPSSFEEDEDGTALLLLEPFNGLPALASAGTELTRDSWSEDKYSGVCALIK